MAHAQCSRGSITPTLPEPSKLVVACHCLDCQRRTGAPFRVGAFYPAEEVTITETPKEYARIAASGAKVYSYFAQTVGLRCTGKPRGCQTSSALQLARWRTQIMRRPSDQSSSNRNIPGFRLKAPTFSTSNKEARQKAQTKNCRGTYAHRAASLQPAGRLQTAFHYARTVYHRSPPACH